MAKQETCIRKITELLPTLRKYRKIGRKQSA